MKGTLSNCSYTLRERYSLKFGTVVKGISPYCGNTVWKVNRTYV